MSASIAHHRFAEFLHDLFPDADEIAFADLVDACVERLLATIAEVEAEGAA